MTPPKLSTLTGEQRRTLCAEALGWTFFKTTEEWQAAGSPTGSKICVQDQRPKFEPTFNPDSDANDALALVEHLREKGRSVTMTNDQGDWFCASYILKEWPNGDEYRKDEAESCESTLPRAITSAFLLAIGAATVD